MGRPTFLQKSISFRTSNNATSYAKKQQQQKIQIVKKCKKHAGVRSNPKINDWLLDHGSHLK